jgi:prevent-host-death family protein
LTKCPIAYQREHDVGNSEDSRAEGVPIAEVRRNLADLMGRVAYGKESVVVTRHGKGMAALVPVEDLALLNRVRAYVQRRQAEDALRELDTGQTVAWSELKGELGL